MLGPIQFSDFKILLVVGCFCSRQPCRPIFEAKLRTDFSQKNFLDKLHQLRNTTPMVDHFQRGLGLD